MAIICCPHYVDCGLPAILKEGVPTGILRFLSPLNLRAFWSHLRQASQMAGLSCCCMRAPGMRNCWQKTFAPGTCLRLTGVRQRPVQRGKLGMPARSRAWWEMGQSLALMQLLVCVRKRGCLLCIASSNFFRTQQQRANRGAA